jgi:hypothetical protein
MENQSNPAPPEASPIQVKVSENTADFQQLRESLRQQCLPHGRLEEEHFQAYAWSLFFAERMRAHELNALEDLEADPEDLAVLRRLDLLGRILARHQRLAKQALAELGRLQATRLASAEANKLIQASGQVGDQLPASLPPAAARKNPMALASQFAFNRQVHPAPNRVQPSNPPPASLENIEVPSSSYASLPQHLQHLLQSRRK